MQPEDKDVYREAESEGSRTASVFAIRNFQSFGLCFGKNGKEIYIRTHGEARKKDGSLQERTRANHSSSSINGKFFPAVEKCSAEIVVRRIGKTPLLQPYAGGKICETGFFLVKTEIEISSFVITVRQEEKEIVKNS